MKRGFTVIEILISMMVLFVAIAFVNISIKAYNNYQRKSNVYQNFYITALSLKDLIASQPLDKESLEGDMNKIHYKLNIKPVLKAKNYNFTMEFGGGNNGNFMITLYEVEMSLTTDLKEEKFKFLLTRQKSLFSKPIIYSEGISQ